MSWTPPGWSDRIGKVYREGRRLKVLKYKWWEKTLISLCYTGATLGIGAGAGMCFTGAPFWGALNIGMGVVNYLHVCHGVRAAKHRMLTQNFSWMPYLEALRSGKFAFPKLLMEAFADSDDPELKPVPWPACRATILEAYFTGIAKKNPAD